MTIGSARTALPFDPATFAARQRAGERFELKVTSGGGLHVVSLGKPAKNPSLLSRLFARRQAASEPVSNDLVQPDLRAAKAYLEQVCKGKAEFDSGRFFDCAKTAQFRPLAFSEQEVAELVFPKAEASTLSASQGNQPPVGFRNVRDLKLDLPEGVLFADAWQRLQERAAARPDGCVKLSTLSRDEKDVLRIHAKHHAAKIIVEQFGGPYTYPSEEWDTKLDKKQKLLNQQLQTAERMPTGSTVVDPNQPRQLAIVPLDD